MSFTPLKPVTLYRIIFFSLHTKNEPSMDCDVCSVWKEVIKSNHTNPGGWVNWKNSKPHLWATDKLEVAKVYMTNGLKNHKSIYDFDIAAILSLMTHCKHFKKFELGDSCAQVSSVRNKISHSPHYQLEKKDFHNYLHQIKAFCMKLETYDPQIRSLCEEIDEFLDQVAKPEEDVNSFRPKIQQQFAEPQTHAASQPPLAIKTPRLSLNRQKIIKIIIISMVLLCVILLVGKESLLVQKVERDRQDMTGHTSTHSVSLFGNLSIASLLFADDVALLASSTGDLQQALGRFEAECEVRVSTSKSEDMVLCQKMVDCPHRLGDELLPQVRDFNYLRVFFISDWKREQEMDRWFGAAPGNAPSLRKKPVEVALLLSASFWKFSDHVQLGGDPGQSQNSLEGSHITSGLEHLTISQEELESVAGVRDVRNAQLRLLPLQPNSA